MKDKNKEQWIQSVINSTEGIQRAKPPVDLFAKIEQKVGQQTSQTAVQTEVKVISFTQWRWAVAAAVLLLFLNVFSLRQYVTSQVDSENTEQLSTDQLLVSDYNFYEQ